MGIKFMTFVLACLLGGVLWFGLGDSGKAETEAQPAGDVVIRDMGHLIDLWNQEEIDAFLRHVNAVDYIDDLPSLSEQLKSFRRAVGQIVHHDQMTLCQQPGEHHARMVAGCPTAAERGLVSIELGYDQNMRIVGFNVTGNVSTD
ncbi:MAG: hypothetical protein JJU36_16745 [Phycisphaeraceae bacterium]|nr:hypothetical protein [Phycisphaeraceae bacterium]